MPFEIGDEVNLHYPVSYTGVIVKISGSLYSVQWSSDGHPVSILEYVEESLTLVKSAKSKIVVPLEPPDDWYQGVVDGIE